MRALLERRIILVAGKGGVGRTTVAAALGVAAAALGRRVLVAEIGEPGQGFSPLGRLLGRDHLTERPVGVTPHLSVGLISPREGQSRFLHTVLPSAIPVKRVLQAKAMSSLIDAAPSLNEMGVFYHFLAQVKAGGSDGRPSYETVILDMPATGHALALTSLPDVLLRLLPDGRIADTLREGQRYMYDPALTAACVVTLPETLPVTESLELMEGLKADKVPVGAVIVNRFPEDPFTEGEKDALGPLLTHPDLYGVPSWQRIKGSRRALDRLLGQTTTPIFTAPELDLGANDGLLRLSGAFARVERRHV